MHRTFLSLLLLGATTGAFAQGSSLVPQMSMVSCTYADSLLGDDWERGKITAGRAPNGDIVLISRAPGRITTSIELDVTVEYRDRTAPRDPPGRLKMVVFNDRGLATALANTDTASLALVLDDSLTFNLGVPQEGQVTGATRTAHLSLYVALPRAAFLALARARKGEATIGGRSYPIARSLLRAISGTYRTAVCAAPESIPEMRASGG
jgi:hypothetical protein